MTKVLASTIAMMLVEAKALDLDAPVADYIPSFKVLMMHAFSLFFGQIYSSQGGGGGVFQTVVVPGGRGTCI